jgi:hypothetical protein
MGDDGWAEALWHAGNPTTLVRKFVAMCRLFSDAILIYFIFIDGTKNEWRGKHRNANRTRSGALAI